MTEQTERYDILIFSTRARMRVSAAGVRSLVQFMNANAYIAQPMHTVGDGWEEVHAAPGDFAHAILHEGQSRGVAPAFHELAVRFGEAPLDLGYGTGEPVHFYVEVRGAAFDTITDAFLERVDQVLYVRPAYATRLFEGLRPRVAADDAEAREAARKKRPDRTDGRIGVRIEER